MKNTLISRIIISSFGLLACCSASATNLIQVYNQAVHSDPTFRQAESTWLGTKAAIGVSRGALLPLIGATSGWNYTHTNGSSYGGGADSTTNFDTFSYGLNLKQSVFNYKSWADLSNAQNLAKSQQAAYNGAAQGLINRVVTSYFLVLESYNKLHYDLTQKNADYQQYITSKKQFEVGLKAITDVYAAQASYDADVATVLSDRNDVSNNLESLREITGVRYRSLNDIAKQIPLRKPQPSRISQWVSTTQQQNYTIQSDRYSMLAAKDKIKSAFAGHLPTLDLIGGITGSHHSTDLGGNSTTDTAKNNFTATVGLSAALPIFSGGSVVAATKQARYAYLASSDQLEIDSRNATSESRKAYLTVIQDIAKIKADKEGIISSNKALSSTEAGYRVGTQTIYNVLTSINLLSQAQQHYYNDQYDYLQQLINLKLQAGILKASDVRRINSLLTMRINLNQDQTRPRTTDKKIKAKAKKAALKIPQHADRTNQPALKFGDYTIQLFASKNLHSAQTFYHQRNSKHQLYIIKVGSKAKNTFYKVSYGAYPSHKVASRALQEMPGNYRIKFKPWVIHFNRSDETLMPMQHKHKAHSQKPHSQKTHQQKTHSSDKNKKSEATKKPASAKPAAAKQNTTKTTIAKPSPTEATAATASEDAAANAPETTANADAGAIKASKQAEKDAKAGVVKDASAGPNGNSSSAIPSTDTTTTANTTTDTTKSNAAKSTKNIATQTQETVTPKTVTTYPDTKGTQAISNSSSSSKNTGNTSNKNTDNKTAAPKTTWTTESK